MLDLNNNQLNYSIPPELGNLSNLQTLNLDHNQLYRSIPPELGNLNNLQELNLNNNQLSDPIPPEFGNLSNLQRLSLNNNQLSGDIPLSLMKAAGYYTFSTAIAGTGTGSLAGSTGNSNYLDGTKITLVATPAAGSTFAGWTPATCVDGFALTANTVCTATFNVGSGTGTAVPSENCAASYDSVSGRLVIPCVTVTMGTQVSNYSVEMQQREGVFTFDLDLNKVIQK